MKTQQTIQKIYDHSSIDPNIEQRKASDPMTSVWVGASAGTGKTKILTDRVLRLMLPTSERSATPPSRILCITFTKAAAAEMANRISKTLGEWAVHNDDKLKEELSNLIGGEPNKDMIITARRLFAEVVDVPGGMKIMTIHAFCQSVLKRFPLEAGLPPHFEVMDERTATEYMTQCQHEVIARSREEGGEALGRALHLLASLLEASSLTDLMGALAQSRSRLSYVLKHHNGYQGVIEELYQQLGISDGLTFQGAIEEYLSNRSGQLSSLRNGCDVILTEGSKTDKEKAERIINWLCLEHSERITGFNQYKRGFLKADGGIYANVLTKGFSKKHEEVLELFEAEAESVLETVNILNSITVAETTSALLLIGSEIIERYQTRKISLAQLDYDDLIYKTCDLLSHENYAAWVLYKLDGGIDHILVDEAQDTNPEQWRVISSMAEEFYTGLGAREDVVRTIFAVGDEKQSIYSFQRADPAEFNRMRDFFKDKVESSENQWRRVNLKVSFRSTSAVLNFVDQVFLDPVSKDGVVFEEDDVIEHIPFRMGEAGLVELWPVFVPQESEEPEVWALPTKLEMSDNSTTRLANKIADTIQEWINTKELLESKNRPISPGDIMVLVKSRGGFVEQFIRSLKTRKIPVSGIDRMVLTEQLPVMDLLALAKFILLPEEDLVLATFLKSPLIGLSEDDLFELSYKRKGTLWSGLKEKHEAIYCYLLGLRQKAGKISPYALFAEVINCSCPADEVSGRRAFLSRLGYDALDSLDEMLNACLDFEVLHGISLQSFVNWFEKGQAQIKREQESGDMVRIMTVHGSKGLQSPIVFMADTISRPRDNPKGRPGILWPKTQMSVPIWVPRQDMEDELYKELRKAEEEKQDQEYKRLLYVAMTRAEDRLYISGSRGKRKMAEDCWYSLIYNAFKPIAEEIDFKVHGKPVLDDDGNELSALRFISNQTKDIKEVKMEEVSRIGVEKLPDWARQDKPEEPFPSKPLMPSRPEEAEPAVCSPLGEDNGWRFRRGNLAHQLLEILPEMKKDQWEKVIINFLSRAEHQLSETQQYELKEELLKVLNDVGFASIFGVGSRAEVPVTGLVGRGDKSQVLSGSIDRLLVTEDEVLIVDYKTNRPPPITEEGVQIVYLKQLAAYKSAIVRIYPDKQVRCALLWTDGPHLMEISPERLDPYVL